jgi:hypothetical protein
VRYLGRAHDEHRPARLHDRAPLARGRLDRPDLAQRPLHARRQVAVDVVQVRDEARLVAVPGEQRRELPVVHRAVHGALADLEAVDVHDRQHGAALARVDVLGRVPRGRGRARLGLAVADDADGDELRAVHDGAEGDGERVAELAALVDRAGRLGVDVRGEAARAGEGGDERGEAAGGARVGGVERRERVFEPEAGEDAGPAVAW